MIFSEVPKMEAICKLIVAALKGGDDSANYFALFAMGNKISLTLLPEITETQQKRFDDVLKALFGGYIIEPEDTYIDGSIDITLLEETTADTLRPALAPFLPPSSQSQASMFHLKFVEEVREKEEAAEEEPLTTRARCFSFSSEG